MYLGGKDEGMDVGNSHDIGSCPSYCIRYNAFSKIQGAQTM
jgi:hypothetical protein